jgi:hypothetical protein
MIDGKIEFNDLNGWLKVAVVGAYIVIGLYAIMFVAGFIQGVLS